jgi:hypothetical protein
MMRSAAENKLIDLNLNTNSGIAHASASESRLLVFFLNALYATAIFVFALGLRYWFNFIDVHINCASSCDASEYLRDAMNISRCLSRLDVASIYNCLLCLIGLASPTVQTTVQSLFAPLKEMSISGPVFPLFLAFSGAGQELAASFHTKYAGQLLSQTVLSSLSCVLIFVIGWKAWDRHVGLVSGLISAVYPAFIINSGRLYSETFSTFLICLIASLVVWQIASKKTTSVLVFVLGIALAALQLTRSLMGVLTGAILLVSIFQSGMRRQLVPLLLGLAVILLPWMALQKLAFNKIDFVVNRAGHYNVFVGNNVDSQGWLSYPYPDGRGIEKKSFNQLLLESYQRSPSRWLKLLLDKSARLFKFPWNDFRTSIASADFAYQVLIHQTILAFGFVGAVLALVTNIGSTEPAKEQINARLFLIGLVALHLFYLLFITVPRYNLTSMPFIILFAAGGLMGCLRLFTLAPRNTLRYALPVTIVGFLLIIRLDVLNILYSIGIAQNINVGLLLEFFIKLAVCTLFCTALGMAVRYSSGNRFLARSTCAILGLLVAVCASLPCRANGRIGEFGTVLDRSGERITQTVELPGQNNLDSKHCYLMIDSDGVNDLQNGVSVLANGKLLDGPIIPGLALIQKDEAFKIVDQTRLLLESEYIFDSLTQAAGKANADLRQWFFIPLSADILDEHHLTIEIVKTADTKSKFFGSFSNKQIPSENLYSWEKAFYGVENDRGLTDPRYDTKFQQVEGVSEHQIVDAQARLAVDSKVTKPDSNKTNYFIRLLAPKNIVNAENTNIDIGTIPAAHLTRSHSSSTNEFKLGDIGQNRLWLVRVTGNLKSDQMDSPAINLRLCSKQGEHTYLTYDSPWARRNFNVSDGYKPFDFVCPVDPKMIPGTLSNLELELRTDNSVDSGSVDFQNIKVSILAIPKNPLSDQYAIY